MGTRVHVNGRVREVDVDPDTPLLWVLRDALGLTGTKFGCGVAQCGACTVHVDGKATRACALPIRLLGDRRVTTIEGVRGREADAVLAAWSEHEVPQCGYCQPGQVMTTVALLRQIARPGSEDVEGALAGNVCRCATYDRIRKAVKTASEKLEV